MIAADDPLGEVADQQATRREVVAVAERGSPDDRRHLVPERLEPRRLPHRPRHVPERRQRHLAVMRREIGLRRWGCRRCSPCGGSRAAGATCRCLPRRRAGAAGRGRRRPRTAADPRGPAGHRGRREAGSGGAPRGSCGPQCTTTLCEVASVDRPMCRRCRRTSPRCPRATGRVRYSRARARRNDRDRPHGAVPPDHDGRARGHRHRRNLRALADGVRRRRREGRGRRARRDRPTSPTGAGSST